MSVDAHLYLLALQVCLVLWQWFWMVKASRKLKNIRAIYQRPFLEPTEMARLAWRMDNLNPGESFPLKFSFDEHGPAYHVRVGRSSEPHIEGSFFLRFGAAPEWRAITKRYYSGFNAVCDLNDGLHALSSNMEEVKPCKK